MRKLVFIIALMTSGVVHAATVQLDGLNVTGIENFEYAGTLYDVNFIYGTFGEVYTAESFPLYGQHESVAVDAMEAIAGLVNAAGATGVSADGVVTQQMLLAARSMGADSTLAAVSTYSGSWSSGGTVQVAASGSNIWATMTVVPIPAAFVLLLSALGLLPVIRRAPRV